MSLENEVKALTDAVNALVTVMSNAQPQPTQAPVTPSTPEPAPAPQSEPAQPPQSEPAQPPRSEPAQPPQPASQPAQPDSGSMPPPPAFDQSAAATAPSPDATASNGGGKAPFNDGTGLVNYVMDAYKAVGAEKGAEIGNILQGLGYSNVNDVRPEHYDALYEKVEALKT